MGSLEGVIDTRSAWIGKHEVVEVRFQPEATPFADLVRAAVAKGCADRVWTTTDAQRDVAARLVGEKAEALASDVRAAKEGDQLYYLERSVYRYLPLTPLQARRINGALYAKVNPATYLSPRQAATLEQLERALRDDENVMEGLRRPHELGALA